ncbi:MAG TPA: hypothetical protein PK743_04890 [Luteimonas sp.]|nr:hypothetical protein [Luteimonas sp.]HRO26693.1 hypothetical protein [Luteimonas sp.]HRP71961.1 hypothetical protein [Luteimonas sp.]
MPSIQTHSLCICLTLALALPCGVLAQDTQTSQSEAEHVAHEAAAEAPTPPTDAPATTETTPADASPALEASPADTPTAEEATPADTSPEMEAPPADAPPAEDAAPADTPPATEDAGTADTSAQVDPVEEREASGSAIRIASPPEDKGHVVFFREKKFAGAAIIYKVREGEEELGQLNSGTYFVHVAEPGQHEYTVRSEAKDALNLEVEPGETYYVVGGVAMGILAGRPNLAPSDEAAFEQASAKLKPSKDIKKK